MRGGRRRGGEREKGMRGEGKEEELGEGGRKKEETKSDRRRKGNNLRITFWNMAGLKKKEEEFWRGLEEWDVVVLIETWIEEGIWKKIRKKLPRGYKWRMQAARRERSRGRAKGGWFWE